MAGHGYEEVKSLVSRIPGRSGILLIEPNTLELSLFFSVGHEPARAEPRPLLEHARLEAPLGSKARAG